MPAPIVTIKTISKTKISDEVGQDQSVVTFTADKTIRAWEVRANGIYQGSGLLLGKSDHLFPSEQTFPTASTFPRNFKHTANTDITFQIDNEELQQDNIYRVDIYACSDDDGTWNTRDLKKVRYIRDHLDGSTANAYNHWVEIQALDSNLSNVALNKATTSQSGSTSTIPTDGNTASSPYWGFAKSMPYITVDLGAVYELDSIKVWHYYADGRTYHKSKTEISVDGVNWETVFDSQVSGKYPETSSGRETKL